MTLIKNRLHAWPGDAEEKARTTTCREAARTNNDYIARCTIYSFNENCSCQQAGEWSYRCDFEQKQQMNSVLLTGECIWGTDKAGNNPLLLFLCLPAFNANAKDLLLFKSIPFRITWDHKYQGERILVFDLLFSKGKHPIHHAPFFVEAGRPDGHINYYSVSLAGCQFYIFPKVGLSFCLKFLFY